MSFDALLPDLPILALLFMASGVVKGLSGFGMPFIAVPGATILLNVPLSQAIAWVLASGLATNLTQLVQTRRHWPVVRQIWLLVAVMVVAMALSVQLLASLDPHILTLILGVVMVISIGAQWFKDWTVAPQHRSLAFAVSGAVGGLFGGLTSFYGFPSLQVMLASGLRKDEFIFAASFMLLTGTLVLAVGLGGQGLMSATDALLSVLLFIPALVGLSMGQWLRRRMSPEAFTKVVLIILLATGVSLIGRSLLG